MDQKKPFLISVLIMALGLFAIHSYLMVFVFKPDLLIPLWTIYVFNAALVIVVFLVIENMVSKGNKKVLYAFLGLTIGKMLLALVFLLPLFLQKSEHQQLEIFNFFIPYFAFLTLEILSLNKFLQKL